MTSINRLQTVFTGFAGGPGYATMYFLDSTTAVESVYNFWNYVLNAFPSDVHIQVSQVGDTIEDTTGALTGAWEQGAVDGIDGSNTAPYVAPTGGHVRWLTGTVLDGHRVQGRTFAVPLAGNAYTTIGTVSSGIQTLFQSAADALVSAETGKFTIWHRPYPGRAAVGTVGAPHYKAAKAAHAGGNAVVTSGIASALATVLRSRRD